MAVSKERLREVLEEAMEDVAMLMSDNLQTTDRLREIRDRCAEVWKMADLGEVPEWEAEVRLRRVG